MTRLGKYFTLEELVKSNTAQRRKLSNSPNEQQIQNLRNLVLMTLDPLRSLLSLPLVVNSGFRSPAVNAAVGGVSNSQHCKGEAADITASSPSANRLLLKIILENYSTLSFDQVIAEKCDKYGCPRWIHVSYRIGHNRKEILFR